MEPSPSRGAFDRVSVGPGGWLEIRGYGVMFLPPEKKDLSMQNRISLHLNDLLIGICLLALCSTAMVMAINGEREVSRRLKCQLNLRQIASAIQDYQDQNHQAYPRTVAGNADNLTPTWGTPYQTDKAMGPIQGADPFDGKTKAMPAANDVTASLFLLMRTEKITTAAFVCPSSGATPWDFGGGPNTAMNWTNFAGNDGIAKHLSYSFQNFFASRHAIANGFQVTSPDATFAVAADLNPGGAAVVSVTPRSTPEKIHTANSHNHKQDGQNVLYSDGHAEWERSPFSGAEHDNIYTAGGPEIQGADRKTATVVASPVDSNDSVLLPTAADVGINERLPNK
jgi:hypothetical protein